jgi:hypothetical protein
MPLIAGTRIATESGPVPIEILTTDATALARSGYVAISAVGIDGHQAVYTVVFDNGVWVCGTADHEALIANTSTWRRFDALAAGDELQTNAEDTNNKPGRPEMFDPKPLYVERVYADGSATVYDLTVSGNEYFAEGVLLR